jgi:hypothetical protein
MASAAEKVTMDFVPMASAGIEPHECVCIVCLDSDPPPIQSGCACRSDTGLAHVGCLIEKAVAQQPHRGNAVWWECQTCGQQFTGAMQTGLAEAWWSRVCDEAEDCEERLAAAGLSDGTQLVVHDGGNGMAGRLWWMAKWIGHDAVAVLDGGLGAWRKAGYPLTADATPARAPGTLALRRAQLGSELFSVGNDLPFRFPPNQGPWPIAPWSTSASGRKRRRSLGP